MSKRAYIAHMNDSGEVQLTEAEAFMWPPESEHPLIKSASGKIILGYGYQRTPAEAVAILLRDLNSSIASHEARIDDYRELAGILADKLAGCRESAATCARTLEALERIEDV